MKEESEIMFYLIGLGLNERSISLEALEVCKNSYKIYLDNYTVEFHYNPEKLEGIIGKRVFPLTRTLIEDEKFIEESKRKDIALLVYGSPLIATTHISLLLRCRKEGIKYRVFQNASIFDAVAESGLQFYKFGRTASMPSWTEKYKPDSFVDIIKNNKKIKAHTLILVDIGLKYGDALKQLEDACETKIKLEKIIVCSKTGTQEGKFFYKEVEELYGEEVYAPFCFIVPSELHFLEEEALEMFGER